MFRVYFVSGTAQVELGSGRVEAPARSAPAAESPAGVSSGKLGHVCASEVSTLESYVIVPVTVW